jgi:hypothetical protein
LQSEDTPRIVDARNSQNLSFKNVHYNQPDALPLAMQFTNCTELELFCYWRNWNKFFTDAVQYQRDVKSTVTPESGMAVYRWKAE